MPSQSDWELGILEAGIPFLGFVPCGLGMALCRLRIGRNKPIREVEGWQ